MKTLYRPMGLQELKLILDTGMRAFPPRLAWQPIFYPVLNFKYAAEIAAGWNMRDPEGDEAGVVVAFDLPVDYLSRFQVQTVGLAHHQELWVPAEDLDAFNQQIVGVIRVEALFAGKRCVIPESLREILQNV